MEAALRPNRFRLDRLGIVLSGLCVVHCLLGLVLVAGMGLGVTAGIGSGILGSVLLHPVIHEVGLAAAVVVAALAIGVGALRHRRPAPLFTALVGLGFMSAALAAEHGAPEAILTLVGVVLVGIGHFLNLRRAA